MYDKLFSLRNPARYVGGEFGSIVKTSADYTVAIAFPDMYEIAMSNQAVKIIYHGLNRIDRVRCERVFAPDTDYEELLKKENIPLATLETRIPLYSTDLIAFTIGYELAFTEVFAMLDLGHVSFTVDERNIKKTEGGFEPPLVIAGGCAVTNPAPFLDFFDGIFIGEAEAGFFDLVADLAEAKKNGAHRKDLIALLRDCPAVYYKGRKTVAVRAIWAGFGREPSMEAIFPQPSIKPIQDHGVTEIMRGCPNGCRFCHAGIYYRPQRVKPVEAVVAEVDALVSRGGYREVSLTSLSSADYPFLDDLLNNLDNRFSARQVSFQLPSLKVNSTTLPILEKLSKVRKSSLTFAIETPEESRQLSLNKEVYTSHLVDIIREAKIMGWSSAKFYFMIGLPAEITPDSTKERSEEDLIVSFMKELQERTRIQCSISVGVFVPKPHTPFQWCAQLSVEEAEKKFFYIRNNLPRGKFKVSTHGAFSAWLEGLVSRGDKRVGELVLKAYRLGCRFDAWDDHFRANMSRWEKVLTEATWDVSSQLCKKSIVDILPWTGVSLGVNQDFLLTEYSAAQENKLTARCDVGNCKRCTSCEYVYKNTHNNKEIVSYSRQFNKNEEIVLSSGVFFSKAQNVPVLWRSLFQFTKQNGGEYLSHLNMQEAFRKAFTRSQLPVQYSQGFNPVPRLEFVGNMPVGIESTAEIGACILDTFVNSDDFILRINKALPSGIRVTRAFVFPVSNKQKRESLFSSWWGSTYLVHGNTHDVAADQEKAFRNSHAGEYLRKIATLTKNKTSFFETYQKIAEVNRGLIEQV